MVKGFLHSKTKELNTLLTFMKTAEQYRKVLIILGGMAVRFASDQRVPRK